MKSTNFFLTAFIICACLACQNQSNSDAAASSSDADANTTDQITDGRDLVYNWVDDLTIRKAPGSTGEKITVVPRETPLEFTGEQSETTESIVLRGVCYDEPWLKVIAPDKTEGWVFGGAVKRKGEEKGNAILTDEVFEFPHFGSFNLREWEKGATKDESGGDAEIATTTYKKGNQVLEISRVDVGDYGYGRTYKLMDANNNILKERELNFSADAEMRELREVVKDYSTKPGKQYTRTQSLKKHHSQLNAWPLMVNGDWTEGSIEE